MRTLLILMLFATTANADYWYVEIGAGANTNLSGNSIPWEDVDEVGCMFAGGRVVELSSSHEIDLNWSHYSQCFAGYPFNDKKESSLDHFGVKYRYKFK